MKMRFLILLLVLGAAAPARADEQRDTEQAKALYRVGTRLYNLGEYAQALENFKTAYRRKDDAAFLFNIAQCQRQLADYEAAGKSYRAFVRESKDLPVATRDEVQRLIVEMDKAVREGRSHQPPIGTRPPEMAQQEGKAAAADPAPPVPLAPAPTTVVAAAPPPTPWYRDAAGWSLLAGGVAIGATGGGLLGHGFDLTSSVNDAPSLAARMDLQSSSDTFRSAGYALIGIGAAAAVSGAVVFIVRSLRAHPRAALNLNPQTGDAAFAVGGAP
jgi:tetratricopeptide (TPR) repeat protein